MAEGITLEGLAAQVSELTKAVATLASVAEARTRPQDTAPEPDRKKDTKRFPVCPECDTQAGVVQYVLREVRGPNQPDKIKHMCECPKCAHKWQVGAEVT